jgi:hypothetical protein
VIRVLPQSQAEEDHISNIDHTVTVATIGWSIKFSQRQKTISVNSRGWSGLIGGAAKQLAAVVNQSIAISIESQPGIVTAGRSPRKTIGDSVVVEIEIHAVRGIRQIETITLHVNNNGRLILIEAFARSVKPLAIKARIQESPLPFETSRVRVPVLG